MHAPREGVVTHLRGDPVRFTRRSTVALTTLAAAASLGLSLLQPVASAAPRDPDRGQSAAAHRRSPGPEVLATLEVWDSHLARLGAELLAARLDLVWDLTPAVAKAYAALAPGGGAVSLAYRTSIGDRLPPLPVLAAEDGRAPFSVLLRGDGPDLPGIASLD